MPTGSPGGQATDITWTLPEGWKAGEVVWATPHRQKIGPLMNYGYQDQVLLPVPLTVPASAKAGEKVTLKAHANFLVCEEICIPEQADLSITLPVADGLAAPDPRWGAAVAKALAKRKIDYFTAYVCENLGARNERVTRGSLADIAGQKFDPLNVMILVRSGDAPDRPRDASVRSLFGNPDEAFVQSKPKHGLLTPAEVRAVALAQMALSPRSIVWDVGAGSGSVSVEAAMLAPGGQVFAIEQDAEDIELVRENADRFTAENVIPVMGRAPEVWADLPDPDAVFIEGSGREIARQSGAMDARRALPCR